jgi:hypothetical protein
MKFQFYIFTILTIFDLAIASGPDGSRKSGCLTILPLASGLISATSIGLGPRANRREATKTSSRKFLCRAAAWCRRDTSQFCGEW